MCFCTISLPFSSFLHHFPSFLPLFPSFPLHFSSLSQFTLDGTSLALPLIVYSFTQNVPVFAFFVGIAVVATAFIIGVQVFAARLFADQLKLNDVKERASPVNEASFLLDSPALDVVRRVKWGGK